MRGIAALLLPLSLYAALAGSALAAATPPEMRPPAARAPAGSHAAPRSGPAPRAAAAPGARAAKAQPPGRRPALAAPVPRPALAPPTSGPARPPAPSPLPRANNDSRIAAARELYQAGRYAEVPTALVKLLAESQLTAPQLAAVYELLASAYVALGQTELAIRCFSEVLSRRPAFALDPVRVSPKIRAALDQARRDAARPPVAPLPTHRPL